MTTVSYGSCNAVIETEVSRLGSLRQGLVSYVRADDPVHVQSLQVRHLAAQTFLLDTFHRYRRQQVNDKITSSSSFFVVYLDFCQRFLWSHPDGVSLFSPACVSVSVCLDNNLRNKQHSMYLFDAVVPEQAMADAVIGNESVPIQLGWPFPVLKCKCIFFK